ncbi:MAG: hypothetical protein LBV46_02250 [Bacteroidales bacterium]|jgi:hypothetical protein|nr:hypothetical protein [Bacteroidales bacterium]
MMEYSHIAAKRRHNALNGQPIASDNSKEFAEHRQISEGGVAQNSNLTKTTYRQIKSDVPHQEVQEKWPCRRGK